MSNIHFGVKQEGLHDTIFIFIAGIIAIQKFMSAGMNICNMLGGLDAKLQLK